jgi:hypothetical protein
MSVLAVYRPVHKHHHVTRLQVDTECEHPLLKAASVECSVEPRLTGAEVVTAHSQLETWGQVWFKRQLPSTEHEHGLREKEGKEDSVQSGKIKTTRHTPHAARHTPQATHNKSYATGHRP